MKRLYLFKDQKDFEKNMTEDKIINIIGTKGSGKTTTSLPYIQNADYIVVNCDRLFELPSDEQEDKELSTIRSILKKKYGELPTGKEFLNCYIDIIEYILSKNKKALIEGNVIQNIDPKCFKGKIIVKRTAIFKSFIRAIKRDYQNQYFMNLEKEKHKYLYKLTRLYKITKRRLNIFQTAKEIEKKIECLENG